MRGVPSYLYIRGSASQASLTARVVTPQCNGPPNATSPHTTTLHRNDSNITTTPKLHTKVIYLYFLGLAQCLQAIQNYFLGFFDGRALLTWWGLPPTFREPLTCFLGLSDSLDTHKFTTCTLFDLLLRAWFRNLQFRSQMTDLGT